MQVARGARLARVFCLRWRSIGVLHSGALPLHVRLMWQQTHLSMSLSTSTQCGNIRWAGCDHGQAGCDHGQTGCDHGQAECDYGQAGCVHRQAGVTMSRPGVTMGRPNVTTGRLGRFVTAGRQTVIAGWRPSQRSSSMHVTCGAAHLDVVDDMGHGDEHAVADVPLRAQRRLDARVRQRHVLVHHVHCQAVGLNTDAL
eukprot:366319-Chlamydomonas_euryale.AAC.5